MTPRFAYFDTSLLVPLYVRSKASPQAERTLVEFTENGELPVVLSELTRVEFVSVIARYVRTNQIDRVRAQEVIGVFERHCRHDFAMLPVRSSDYAAAQQWLKQLSTSLRTLDGLHMAVAFANRCILVTADKQLAAAATVFDIEHHFIPFA